MIGYLSFIVLIPLAAVIWKSTGSGLEGFWNAVTSPAALASLKLTFGASVVVALVNAVMGTLIAWVLVRDDSPARGSSTRSSTSPSRCRRSSPASRYSPSTGQEVRSGSTSRTRDWRSSPRSSSSRCPSSCARCNPWCTSSIGRWRRLRPLGAGGFTIFRRVILPNLVPAILSGVALAFARAVGEFGAVILISGNIPFKTQVASVQIFSNIESDRPTAAAALSVVLLAFSFLTLLAIDLVRRWGSKHES